MVVRNFLAKMGDKAADLIAKSAVLSPSQLKDIEEKRNKYLDEMPNPNDEASIELTNKLLAACGVEIYNAYLGQIKDWYRPIDIRSELEGHEFKIKENIRYFNITKWVVDKKEQSLDKLVNVYEVLSKTNCNIALIFNRKKTTTNVYLAVANLDNESMDKNTEEYKNRLVGAIKGNFPGTEILDNNIGGIVPCFENKDYSIAAVSNIPAEKSEKYISQTIEKLLDGIIPTNIKEEYTIVLLATPVQDVETRKLKLGEFYSALNPYAKWETGYQVQESNMNSSSGTFGVNVGAGVGVQCGTNQTSSSSKGQTDSESTTDSKTTGETVSHGTGSGTNVSHGENQGSSDAIGEHSSKTGGLHAGTPFLGGNVSTTGGTSSSHSWSRGTTDTTGTFTSTTDSIAKSTTNTIAKTLGKAITSTLGNSEGATQGKNFGLNFGANFARSSTVTASIGKNESISQSFINYNIKHTLDLLEEQMKRLEQSSALGLWDFAAYVMSADYTISNNVAHSYLALTQGDKSYLSNAAINIWNGCINEERADAKEIYKYISELRHPLFALNPDKTRDDPSLNVYPTTVDATTSLSGKELAYSLNFPKKSISGMPVIECAEFGRNISTFDDNNYDGLKFNIGNIFHMHHEEKNIPVSIDEKSLASHTFITGSTGSGKSNTVYQILNEAIQKDVKFMVVEPTKGEYKDVFCVGDNPIAKVYGTNPEKTPLLRINPFSFPNDIHVFEHMDRLVEIFNVCWPMYAAMPAVLKNAIEKSYEDCGWDLIDSKNPYGENLYPNFNDVARNVKQIIESSEYDAENKGAYKGSLLTRLESLTNGINGLIFTNDEISLEELFDENVVIDISRVGSNETKSLIMGMMVLKLQEYRMANRAEMNSELKHLTVLEEAHNLLKRTSTEVSQDSGNLLGKSVEMISNAIAEMRTYGEGFIIVDQAPGLLDMAAIRNTNTKIIMRLPDEADRKLVGKAANLNDDQIVELARLPMGVGAIYQNEWIEPVLCKIHRFDTPNEKFQEKENKYITNRNVDELLSIFELLSNSTKITDENKLKDITEKLRNNNINSSAIVSTLMLLQNPPREPRMSKFAPVTAAMFPELIETIKKSYKESTDKIEWYTSVCDRLQLIIKNNIEKQVMIDIVVSAVNQYLFLDLNNKDNVYSEFKNEIGG